MAMLDKNYDVYVVSGITKRYDKESEHLEITDNFKCFKSWDNAVAFCHRMMESYEVDPRDIACRNEEFDRADSVIFYEIANETTNNKDLDWFIVIGRNFE